MTKPAPMLADAFKVSIEGDKVVIEFGVGNGLGPAGQPIARVTDRLVLPKSIAHRLVLQLDDAMKPHAAALRMAEAQALPPGRAAETVRNSPPPARPAADESGTRAAQLIRLVGDLDIPHQYERSFRVSAHGIQANRFLLTLNVRDLPGDPAAQVLAICDRMAMPADARVAARESFGMANCIHFGFEGDATGLVCKLYLERAVPPEEARSVRASGGSALLHLAFKWNMGRGDWVTTRYRWYPALRKEEIQARMQDVYGTAATSCGMAHEILEAACARVGAERLQYLEVDEVENSRRSFDLNLYNAKMQVRDIQPALYRMRDHFGVRPGQFQALYDQVNGLALGHLAGGLHRRGEDFFNIYYGVVGLPHYSDRFAPGRQDA